MTTSGPGELTCILVLVGDLGRAEALDRLFPVVYGELRAIAATRLRARRSGHTLQTNGLVHEPYWAAVCKRVCEFRYGSGP